MNLRLAIVIIGMAISAQGIDCLRVSGPWEAPVSIWQDRWFKYNGSVVEVSTAACAAVEGYYLPGDSLVVTSGVEVARRKWRQVGGGNWGWFGNGGSPISTFDAWYFGDPNCVRVPIFVGRAIPRLPTFVPNQPGLGGRNFQPWDRPVSNGGPRVDWLVVTEAQASNLVVYGMFDISSNVLITVLDDNVILPPFSVEARAMGVNLEISWPGVGGSFYTLWYSWNLYNWLILREGIMGTPPMNVEWVTDVAGLTGLFFRVTSP